MSSQAISLHEPRFDQEDERYVLEALRSTWVSTGGPMIDAFEREIAQLIGVAHAVSTSNGTVALQIATECLANNHEVGPGFEVILPTLTFLASANAIVHAGGNVRLMDVAPGSMNLDAFGARAFIETHYRRNSGRWLARDSGRRLLAIMPVHVMGYSCDLSALRQICDDLGLPLIEDAAEALGSRLDGRALGSFGNAACLSFNGNKILTTGGGGMILTNDHRLASRARHLITTAKVDGLRFVHDEVGYNFRLVNILAALGVSQLRRLPITIDKKRRLAEAYRSELRSHPKLAEVTFFEDSQVRKTDFSANHWLVNLQFPNKGLRERALNGLISRGIQARPLWTPIHYQPAYQGLLAAQEPSRFPNADNIWSTALSVPSSPHLDQSDVEKIVAQMAEAVGP